VPWTWHWHPHPSVWALVLVTVGLWWYAIARIGPRVLPPGATVVTPGQRRNFALAILTLVVAAEFPIHDLAEGYLYSVHMVQHMLLTLVFPPLLLTALPAWLVRRLLPGPVMRVARFVSRPLIALVFFNAVLVFTHWPVIVTASVNNELTHFSLHVLIVASAIAMWMPVLSPVLEIPRLSYPGQMVYLFLQSLVPTVPASFLTFGDRPLYAIYETFPRVLGISALTDQRTAGLIMKIAGGAILWAFMTAIFFKWFRTEDRDGIDTLGWRDVDRTLNRMELTK